MSDSEYRVKIWHRRLTTTAWLFRLLLREQGIEKACEGLKKEYKSHILETVRLTPEERIYLTMVEL